MSIKEYIEQLRGTQKKLSDQEEFEVCAEITCLINAIETGNVKDFIDLTFDVKSMKKVGFFKKAATYQDMEERIKYYFGFENIFEYVIREGIWCPYERYANGIYDTKRKINF